MAVANPLSDGLVTFSRVRAGERGEGNYRGYL